MIEFIDIVLLTLLAATTFALIRIRNLFAVVMLFSIFSLLAAFRGVLERATRRPRMVLPPEQMSIEDRIGQLLSRLSETEACGFEDLFNDGDGSRPFMIVTFLALLEMIRLKLIRVFQAGQMGPIRIYKRARPTDAPHPIQDPEDEFRAHHAPAAPEAKTPPPDDEGQQE